MAYGQAATATLPTVNVTFGPTYATLINAALSEVRATLGAKVTPGGMDMNADLSMRSGASYYGFKDVQRLSMQTQGTALAAATYPGALYVSPAGELWYNDTAGHQVPLTLSGSVTGAAGNIDGTGYGTGGVQVTWASGDSSYSMYSGAGTYADVIMDDLVLSDGSSNFLRMTTQAMAADYTLVFPAAVAATNSILAASTSGSTTTLEFTPTPTITSLVTTSTITAGGLVTASEGVTAAANKHVTVSGTGRHKHGSMQLVIPYAAWDSSDHADDVGTVNFGTYKDYALQSHAAANLVFRAPIILPVGARVTAVTFRTIHGSSAFNRIYALCYSASGGGARTVIKSALDGTDGTGTGGIVQVSKTLTLSGSELTDATFVNSRQYWLEFATVAVVTEGVVMALVTYDFL